MSVGELERVYGRNAQVELRSAPVQNFDANGYDANGYDASGYDANGYYQQDAYEEPVEVPVRRSPWLPMVVVLMLGIGAFLGYGMYRRGLIPQQLAASPVQLQKTESLPVDRKFTAIPALPRISTEVASTVSGATPAEALPLEAEAAPERVHAPKPRSATRSSAADEAATLEVIRRERERAATPEAPAETESTPPEYREDPAPVPGYIEAEVR